MRAERLQKSTGRWVMAVLIAALIGLAGGCNSSDEETATPSPPPTGNPATGDPGTLDTGFDSDGIFVFDSGNGFDMGVAVVVDNAGAVYVSGEIAASATNGNMAIWKVTPAGALDTGFATVGYVSDDGLVADGHENGGGLRLDADGNIVVVGSTDDNGTNADLAVWRYTAAGALDTTFDSDGLVTADSGARDEGTGIGIDADGNVVISGTADYGSTGGQEMTVWRYTSAGAADAAFGTGGHVSYTAPGGKAFSYSLVVGTNEVTATGTLDTDMGMWRFDGAGAPDTTFDSDGVAQFSAAGDAAGNQMVQDSQGRYLVAGFVNLAGGGRDIAVWRLNSDGSPDTTFGTGGLATYDGPDGGLDEGWAIALQPVTGADEKILVTGFVTSAANALQMVLVRFAADGTLDTTFNATGAVVRGQDAGGAGDVGFGPSESIGFGVAFGNNRIFVSGIGVNANGDGDMVLWSFNP